MSQALAIMTRAEQEQQVKVAGFIDFSDSEELSSSTVDILGTVILSAAIRIREMMLERRAGSEARVVIQAESGTISSESDSTSADILALLIFERSHREIDFELAKRLWLAVAKALLSLPEDLADIFPGLRVGNVEGNNIHICRL